MAGPGVHPLCVRHLGLCAYAPAQQAMQAFSAQRTATTTDEIWLLEHPPVYTQGRAGRAEHLFNAGSIPVLPSERGGQITYHGPGQLVCYLLLDIQRLALGVRGLVSLIEAALIATLAAWGIPATARRDAPGVYVDQAKIAALGLRIRRGCCSHGLSLNVNMDMTPWAGINACGLGVAVTQMAEHLDRPPPLSEIAAALLAQLVQRLGYTAVRTGAARLPLHSDHPNPSDPKP